MCRLIFGIHIELVFEIRILTNMRSSLVKLFSTLLSVICSEGTRFYEISMIFWKRFEFRWVSKVLGPVIRKHLNWMVLDVGANRGFFTEAILRGHERSAVVELFIIEPNKNMLDRAVSRIAPRVDASTIVHAHPIGLVEKPDVSYSLTQDTKRPSTDQWLTERKSAEQPPGVGIDIETTTIDKLLETYPPHENLALLLKIDVQGMDLQVLRGSLGVLKRIRTYVIVIEVMPTILIEFNESKAAFLEVLETLEYDSFKDVSGKHADPSKEWDRLLRTKSYADFIISKNC